MIVKLLTEHHLEFLSLKEGCKGSSESTLVKIPHCWKSHVAAHLMGQINTMCVCKVEFFLPIPQFKQKFVYLKERLTSGIKV